VSTGASHPCCALRVRRARNLPVHLGALGEHGQTQTELHINLLPRLCLQAAAQSEQALLAPQHAGRHALHVGRHGVVASAAGLMAAWGEQALHASQHACKKACAPATGSCCKQGRACVGDKVTRGLRVMCRVVDLGKVNH